MTTADSIIARQARATSFAIAKFAGIQDARTVHSLVLAGMTEVAKELRTESPPSATPTTAAATSTTTASTAAVVPPASSHVVAFGRNAGQLLANLSTSDVFWYRDAISRALADRAKEQFADRNRQILMEVKAVLAARTEPVTGADGGQS